MAEFIDLHSHSTASDGSFAPAQVAEIAKRSGLTAWALTDHDTIGGVAEAAEAAKRLGLDFVSGIEISAEFRSPGTMHILGYGVDPQSAVLKRMTETLLEGRDNRNPRIIAKLNELGVKVSMEEWQQEAGGEVVGRPHLAAILVRKGYVSSVKEAFNKYIGQGAPAYADKERLAPQRALEMIRQSHGLAVLAHPPQLKTQDEAELETVVRGLVDQGLEGVEVIHSDHTPAMVEQFVRLADRFGLVKTGGSDFHGASKKDIELGSAKGTRIPREYYDGLMNALARRSR